VQLLDTVSALLCNYQHMQMGVGVRGIGMGAILALAVLTLGGCATVSAAGSETPAPASASASATPADSTLALYGTGQQDSSHQIPASTRSATVSFVCTAGTWSVLFGADMRHEAAGQCGGSAHVFTVPVSGGHDSPLTVSIFVPATSRYTLAATFSPKHFKTDAAVRTTCKRVSKALQAAQDAATGWQATASADLYNAEKSAPPLMESNVVALRAAVGTATTSTLGGSANDAQSLLSQACNSNYTPLTLTLPGG
jgi:hypothetical protein